jgi:hypothetical protein
MSKMINLRIERPRQNELIKNACSQRNVPTPAIAAAASIAKDVFSAKGSEVTLSVRDEVKLLFEMVVTLKQHDYTLP